MGQPRVKVSKHDVQQHAQNGSPVAEIAAYFGVSEATISRRFKKVIARARALRGMHLRKLQWKLVTEGNVPVLIFLGKHELGQGKEEAVEEEKIILRPVRTRG